MSEDQKRIEVNWVQAAAGSLAAVTSAVLLSTVGVAGTLIGAALGSLAATLGNAVYSYYIRVTKDRVANASTVAAARITRASSRVQEASEDLQRGVPGADQELAAAGEELQSAQSVLTEAEEEPAGLDWRAMMVALPWKRIAVVASGLFLVAMLTIVGFELMAGRAVSSYTGGSSPDQRTSIPGLGGGSGANRPAPDQGGPTGPGSSQDGTSAPTQAPTPSSGDQSLPPTGSTPTPTGGTDPGSTPTPTPTPSPTPPASPTPTPAVPPTVQSTPTTIPSP